MKDKITIDLEEYKELLKIKGMYEELKNSQCNGNCKCKSKDLKSKAIDMTL